MILKRYRQIIFLVAGLTAISLLLTVLVWRQNYNQPNVEVVFLDIGQGDSILIKTKYNQQILIDGGPDAKALDRLGRNLPFYDHDLDLVIATHPDADHSAGLVNVLERYKVGLFLQDGVVHNTAVYQTLLEKASHKNIPTRLVEARQIYELGDDLILDILYPNTSFAGQDLEDNNAASIVAKLSDGEVDYLFTGDAPLAVEEKLVGVYGDYIKAEVLKVGHHGSNTSTGDKFLAVVKPEAAIIQSGKNNRYGHPHSLVLRRLEERGIIILRNDLLGDIKMWSNGEYAELK